MEASERATIEKAKAEEALKVKETEKFLTILSDTSAILKLFEKYGLEKTKAYATLKKFFSANFHDFSKSNKAYETDLPYKFDVEGTTKKGDKSLRSGQFDSHGNHHGLGYCLWLSGDYAGELA